MQPTIEVIRTGAGLAIQERPRLRLRAFGVPSGGAIDRYSAKWANRLLGNADQAPVLEVLLQGAEFRVLQDMWIALAGADLCEQIPAWSAKLVRAGTLLTFSKAAIGLWAYLAVPGGFAVNEWLGSASVDRRNGLGDVPVAGSALRASRREPTASIKRVRKKALIAEIRRDFALPPTFKLLRGPQFDYFGPADCRRFIEAEWIVSARSDRTGFRLEGPRLKVPHSISSEPVLPGSFQIPGNGQPIVTMVDGPTVGGYAKIAVMRESDLDWFAQCRPGSKIHFEWDD